MSHRSEFRREARAAYATCTPRPAVTDAALAHVPAAIRTYLTRTGCVGRPQLGAFRAEFRGRIRGKPDGPWMTFYAEQYNTFAPTARWYLLDARRLGLRFTALHRFVDRATMEVRVASLFKIVDARGAEMDQSETVTILNDICVLAPSRLLDDTMKFDEVDAQTINVTFSHANRRVAGTLRFDAQGDLVDFYSDDRYQSADGKSYALYRWSTPLSAYRHFGGYRLASRGTALWQMPSGPLVYGEFELIGFQPSPR